MNRTFTSLILAALTFTPVAVFAQEIPEDVKAKIVETANTKIKKGHRNDWVLRQIEAWESINAMSFSVPKAYVEKIKAAAQKKFPWMFAKQEEFINDQTEALAEVLEMKEQFTKDEFDRLLAAFEKKNPDDYRAIVEAFGKVAEQKEEIKNFTIDGMDPSMLEITKQVLAQKFPDNFAEQLKALKKQAAMMSLVADAKEIKEEHEEAQKAKAAAPKRSEVVKKLEEIFRNASLNVTGNGKTASGIVTEIEGRRVLIFPASVFTKDALSVSNAKGEEAAIPTKRVFSSKTFPLMMVQIPADFSIDVAAIEFAQNEEVKTCVAQKLMLSGNIDNELRTRETTLNKLVGNTLKISLQVSGSYYEGSVALNPKTNRIVGICMAPPRDVWTANIGAETKRQYERELEKTPRYLNVYRTDLPFTWIPVKSDKMDDQFELNERLREINSALGLMLCGGGSLADAKNSTVTQKIAEKYLKELDISMDKTKLRVVYRAFINDVIVMLRSIVAKTRPTEFYANTKSDLAFNFSLTSKYYEALITEQKKNTTTLAPKEFKQKF